MKKEIKIPDIAENVETGLIAGILVSVGDRVTTDQPLVEVETDKAATDIPSPYDGTIEEIKVSEGDEVKVGQVIIIIETESDSKKNKEEEAQEESENSEKETESDQPDNMDDQSEQESDDDNDTDGDEPDQEKNGDQEKGQKDQSDESEKAGKSYPAAPSVRRIAREKGVDLNTIKGSGPGNRISKADVLNAVGGKDEKTMPSAENVQLPDFSKWGEISREPMNNIRRLTAERLSDAWRTIPHVTQFDEADLTDLEEFRKENQAKIEKSGGGKLTVTALLLKLTAFALQKYPKFNASIDMNKKEIIYKHFMNIGVAVDTPKGLLVPVVRDVHRKSLADLTSELGSLASRAREGKISPEEMQGGNFTISNLGGIGGTGFTPIVYPPQVAILGVSKASFRQVYRNNRFEQRMILPLSLSYDHRLIDGADGARFLAWLCDVISDPYSILF